MNIAEYRAEIQGVLAGIRSSRKWPEIGSPREGRQEAVFNCDADIIGFGGKPGGNKTFTAFLLGYMKHQTSIMFRQEFAQMKHHIIPKGKEIFTDNVAHWNGQDMAWHFHKGGRFVLGALKHEGDSNRYRGNEWDAMYFDEATEIRQDEIMMVMAWMRGDERRKRHQAYFFFNPPKQPEGRWVIRYFGPWLDPSHPDPALEGEKRWYTVIGEDEVELKSGDPIKVEGEWVHPVSRTFFRSETDENPELGAQYKARLRTLPTTLRRMFLHGDFTAGLEDGDWQIFPTHTVQAAMDRWKPLDEYAGDSRVPPLTAIGVDPARGGDNQTVIAKRYGTWIAPLKKVPGRETPTGGHVVALVLKELEEVGDPQSVQIYVDPIGVGAAVHDELVNAGLWTFGVNVAEASDYTDRSGFYPMANKRAELLMRLLDLIEGYPTQIALPPDNILMQEMTQINYMIRSGKFYAENKEEVKKRLGGQSTDSLDAVALAALGGY